MEFAIKTNIGIYRKENQDLASFINKKDISLAILCDGLGGHDGGKIAAKIAIKNLTKNFLKNFNFKQNQDEEIIKWFKLTIEKIKSQMLNYAINNKNQNNLLDMGTTLVVAIIFKKKIIIFNIGDSRAYIYGKTFKLITKDQNIKNYYLDTYEFELIESSSFINGEALVSALGPKKSLKIDNYLINIDPNLEYLLLTSDGIHDYVEKHAMEAILNKNISLTKKLNLLIKEAIKQKSLDNLTGLIVKIKDKDN